MELRWNFSHLHKVAETLEAVPVPFSLIRFSRIDSIEALLLEGVEIDLAEIDSSAGLLTYQGRQVLLYIPDQGNNITAVLDGDRAAGKRFHVAYCETLVTMRAQNRFERYIATTDVSGEFSVHGFDYYQGEASGTARLHVCINCLKLLNYKQAKVSGPASKVRDAFDLAEFFNTYSSCFPFLPSRTRADADSSNYTADWSAISERVRGERDWSCELCHVSLSAHRSFLHVHHIDGVKNNNNHQNLKVLCAACHRLQPLHERMYVPSEQMKAINALRVAQGIFQRNWESVMTCADPALHGILGVLRRKGWTAPLIEFSPPGLDVVVDVAWPEQRYGISLVAVDSSVKKDWAVNTLESAWLRHVS